jgi:hypothetical protein
VVGQDAKPGSHRKPPHHVGIDLAVAARHDAMLLVRPGQHEPIDQIAIHIAHGAVSIVDLLSLRAAVAAHGHPAGIDDRPALFGLVPDDGGQHRQCDVLRCADPHIGHDQIEQRVNSGAHLGDAVELRGRQRGRR